MIKDYWEWIKFRFNYTFHRTDFRLSLASSIFDKPLEGNTVAITLGWQVTSHAGCPIEKQKVVIIEINDDKPIIFSLETWKKLNYFTKGKIWAADW